MLILKGQQEIKNNWLWHRSSASGLGPEGRDCKILQPEYRNCDGLLDTYCKKNKGNGASRNKKKLQRYHNGESY
jgi:hypothetical protein